MSPRFVAVMAAALAAPAAVIIAVQPPQAGAPAVRLRSGTFRPSAGELPQIRPDLTIAANAPGQRGYYIVQSRGPITEEWKEAVTAQGAELIAYVPDFAFKVRMTPADAARVERMPSVGWVGMFQPAYKLAPRMAVEGRWRPYTVTIERGADVAATAALVSAAGAQLARADGRILTVVADGARLPAIAHVMDVASIDHYDVPVKHNNYGGGAILGTTAAHASGYTGAGQIIAVTDTGLGDGTSTGGHAHIASNRIRSIFNWPGAPSICFTSVTDDGAADVDTGHGTHVTVSALGAGGAAGEATGAAPGATLVFQAVENYAVTSLLCQVFFGFNNGYYLTGVPSDLGPLFTQAYTAGARVHSNSWGLGSTGAYTAESVSVDDFIWRNRDLSIVFSAGNSGADANSDGMVDLVSISAPATAKNVIAVGASENDRQGRYDCDPGLSYGTCGAGGQNTVATYGEMWPTVYLAEPLKGDLSAGNSRQMAPFSGRGPTADGRIKPDVVAPGTWILSGYSDQFQQHYDASPNPQNAAWQYDGWGFPLDLTMKYLGGTSMSTPLVSGAAAVVRNFYQQTSGHHASSALVKATLINSAVDLLDENNDGVDDNRFPVPNAHEGWGRVDIASAVDGSHVFVDQPAGLATAETTSISHTVGSSARPLKVTLAWSDFPSTAGAAVALVNDLDLVVTAPDGTTFVGNAFSGGWSVPGGTADRRNNVENVYIAAPVTGVWTIQISGFNVPMGPQPFALVIDAASGPVVVPPPPPAPAGMTATASAATRISLTWTDTASNEDGFQIERCAGAGCTAFAPRAQVGPNATAFSDTTVAAESTYRYRVRAVNAGGASDYSNVAAATTPVAPPPPPPLPAAPSGLIAFAASATSIALAWADNSSFEDGFQLERCAGVACTSFAARAQLGAGVTSFNDTTVSSGTSYSYRVRATSAAGPSPYSNTATATTPSAPPPSTDVPAAPSGLIASAASSTTIALVWADNSSNEHGFQVERCVGGGCAGFARIAQVGSGVTAFNDTTASAATTYAYRVRAINASGASAYSNVATATTAAAPPPSPLPAAPSGLIAAAASSAVSLAWSDKSANEQTFQIERCTGIGCGGFAQIGQVGANVTAFNDTVIAPGTTYSYRIRAVNTSGASAYSNVATTTTPAAPPPSNAVPAAPSGLIAAAASSTTISLAWSDNSSNEQGFRIERCAGSGCTDFVQIAQTGAGVRALQNTGLSPSTLYRYRVIAFNAQGPSAPSNVAQATTSAAQPAAKKSVKHGR